ncbi:inosine guanosine and [Pluteus cervinus]|uniref:Inosine guanosine and n=1 Tax=Pluteus cervinus TaxID=181527 RepID=A0ACD3B0I4_9AGAR|nr:inosine guanosine and [Pluteus cervinus]
MTTEGNTAIDVAESISVLNGLLPDELQHPRVGIVCGSGLSGLAETFAEVHKIPYSQIPGFATSTVPGHQSTLAFGYLGGVPAVAMLDVVSKFHSYEGYPLSTVIYPIRVMAKLGIKSLFITNAAGSLNPSIPVGTIVVIHDHLALPNLTGFNPLLGPVYPSAPRFLPLSNAYSPSLRRLIFLASHQLSLPPSALTEGTYAWVSGPTYETPAEGRFLRNAGADVVGMSTIPEVLAAREQGVEVCVLSLVTNFVVIPDGYASIKEQVEAELAGKPIKIEEAKTVSHGEVVEVGKQREEVMKALIQRAVELHRTG